MSPKSPNGHPIFCECPDCDKYGAPWRRVVLVAELTAAKARIVELEAENNGSLAHYAAERSRAESAEADAARYRSALTMAKAALLHAKTRLVQLEIVGPMLVHVANALTHCEAALQPHKETKT